MLTLALRDPDITADGRAALILSAFLAHSRQRQLSLSQLNALADLTLGRHKELSFRSPESGQLQISFALGADERILIILNDIDASPGTRFVIFALASFLIGYKAEINREFLSSPLSEGRVVTINVLDLANAPQDLRAPLEHAAGDSSIAIVYSEDKGDHSRDLMIACRPDVQERCQGDPLRATELQFMYADALRSVLFATLEGQVEDEVLRPKIMALLRATIH